MAYTGQIGQRDEIKSKYNDFKPHSLLGYETKLKYSEFKLSSFSMGEIKSYSPIGYIPLLPFRGPYGNWTVPTLTPHFSLK